MSQELENLISIVEVIELIEAQQFFTYYTVNDERVCDTCDRYNQSSMTRTEIIGTFPYLIKYTPTMWVPLVHKNCRCVLLFEETDETPRPKELTTNQLIDTVKDEILSKKQDVLADVNLSKEDKFKIIRREIEVKVHGGKTVGARYVADDLGDIDPDDDDLWDLVALGILDTLYRRKKREESKF